ncbi:MAG TPA: glucokinase [Gemmatimonadaceae bacterium]|nr:glucokinase [Gemmatimonadaceae bacterium]
MRVLAGDIGGTNARLAIVEVTGESARVEVQRQFSSQDAPGLASLVQRFVRESGAKPPTRACFGVACGVIDGVCRPANLPWIIDERELATAIGVPQTSIINDFDAIGHGLALLAPPDVVTLQSGEPITHGTIALIGAGTGLGEAFLVWDRVRYRVHPSEGGHVNFAARDELEWGLYAALRAEFQHVSYERIVSGPGLVHIYRYLVVHDGGERQSIRDEMRCDNPAAVIVRHGVANTDPVCAKAVELFTSLLGAKAGNLALTVLATGGVYVAGGIAPRMADMLRTGPFLSSFRDKGRLSGFVEHVPVHVIMNTNVGLLGAAVVAAGTS